MTGSAAEAPASLPEAPPPAATPAAPPTALPPVARPAGPRPASAPAGGEEHVTWELEPFIPVSRFVILERMTQPELWPGTDVAQVKRFFRYLGAWRHIVYNERLDELERTYMPFNPENDLLRIGEFAEEELESYKTRFIRGIKKLLKQANYVEVSRAEVAEMLGNGTAYGLDLDVDLEEYEECVVFRRGTDYKRERRRTWWTLYLGQKDYEHPIYQRLFVLLKLWPEEVRLKQIMDAERIGRKKAAKLLRKSRKTLPEGVETDKIYVKLFRDIPLDDIEMLFPNTKVKFRLADKIRLGGGAAGATAVGLFGTISKLMAATVFSPMALGLAFVGIAGVLLRQVMNFFNQKTAYMKVLAQNLYFHSLADNRSVVALLANRAEEEDVKEEVLLYSILAKESVRRDELPDVKAAITNYLRQQFNVDVDFDINDALERLTRDRVVIEEPGGMLRALSPQEGIEHLDRLWDGYLQPNGNDRHLLSEESTA